MGYHPYCSNATPDQVRNRTINCDIRFKYRMPPLSPSAMHLIKCLLEPDPVHRIQSDKIVEHSWCLQGQNETIISFSTENGTILQLEELSSTQITELIAKLQSVQSGEGSSTRLAMVNSPETIGNENRPIEKPTPNTAVLKSDTKVPVENYECGECKKTFPSKQKLNVHKIIHLNVKFACNEENCSKSFSQCAKLSAHIKKMHNGRAITEKEKGGVPVAVVPKKSTLCHICNKKYTNKSVLQLHIKNIHSTYECFLCKNKLNSLASLRKHLKFDH